MQHFDIVSYKWGSSQTYKIRVYVTHRSEQVIRCRICAADKVMEIEKKLQGSRRVWQVTGANFKLSNDLNSNTITLGAIGYQIEKALEGPQPKYIHPKNR